MRHLLLRVGAYLSPVEPYTGQEPPGYHSDHDHVLTPGVSFVPSILSWGPLPRRLIIPESTRLPRSYEYQ